MKPIYFRKSIIIIGLGLIIIAAGWMILSSKINQPEIGPLQEDIAEMVVLVIDDGEGLPQTFEAEFEEGMTAFDLLKRKTEEMAISLKTKTYDIGIFIEAIGDKENGQDGKYWMYYVNDEMPMIGAGQQEIKPGDKVEFRFEESSF